MHKLPKWFVRKKILILWKFTDEIHKNLGNRSKMFSGIIEGHCVIPNLDLVEYENLDIIKKNEMYEKFKK